MTPITLLCCGRWRTAGIARTIEEGRYREDVLTRLAAASGALDRTGSATVATGPQRRRGRRQLRPGPGRPFRPPARPQAGARLRSRRRPA
ncbi:metal-sensing transcriptional repressor [Kitasatospora sp. DSM 101779]|nr:metal-sensing transcriptional repressor [Kitasatospora sp. DSM 101779]